MNSDDFDVWWRERGKDAQLPQMRAHLEKALLQKPSRDIEYSILWRLARFHHFAAMKTGEAKNDQTKVARGHFVTGEQRAKRAQDLRKAVQRESTEADFWHAVNAIEAARLTSQFATLWVLPRATRTLQSVAECDEEFHFAGAQRVLGRITHLKPKFLGGGARKSLSWFQDALDVARNSTTLLYYAQALIDANENDEARKTLREIVAQGVDYEWKWEQARDKTVAARLLKNEPRA